MRCNRCKYLTTSFPGLSIKTSPTLFHHVGAADHFFKIANTGNERKAKASHGPLACKAVTKRKTSACEERTGGDTIQRVVGCVVHDECDAAALRGPWQAWTERCMSGTKVAHKQSMPNFKSRDGVKTISERRRVCRRSKCSGLRLELSI